MKRYLAPILTVFVLAISLIGCSSGEQVIFQKVDNLQVESSLRQQDINDKISSYQYLEPLLKQDPIYSFQPDYKFYVCIPEWRNQVKFLRNQYQQLQEIKYKFELETLDGLMLNSVAEQQRIEKEIQRCEEYLNDAQQRLEARSSSIYAQMYSYEEREIESWTIRISEIREQLDFLIKQYQELEELGDFLGE